MINDYAARVVRDNADSVNDYNYDVHRYEW